MSEARTKTKVTQRPTVGRVVSNKMKKSVTVSIERLVQAPGLRQVHPPHHQGHGARRGRRVPRRRHRGDRRVPPHQQAQGVACRRDRHAGPRRDFGLRGCHDPNPNLAECRGQQRRAQHDVYQGVRRLEAPLCAHRRHHQGHHQGRDSAWSRQEGRGVPRGCRAYAARLAPPRRLVDPVRRQRRGAPGRTSSSPRHAHLRARHARAAHERSS